MYQKKYLIKLFGIVTLIIVTITGVVLFSQLVLEKKSDSKNDNNFTLIKEEGAVSYKLPGQQDYIVMEEEEKELPDQSSIKTAEDGLAHLILPNNSMSSLDSNTEIQVNIPNNQVSLQLLSGSTWNRINSLVNTEFKVESANALATVRGTKFWMTSENDIESSGIGTIESSVEIEDKTDNNSQTILEEGNTALIQNKKKIQLNKLNSSRQKTKWFQRNLEIDKEFNKGNVKEINQKIKRNTILKQIKNRKDLIEKFKINNII
jgi:inner membrane protein involved in colicin E2 resistance